MSVRHVTPCRLVEGNQHSEANHHCFHLQGIKHYAYTRAIRTAVPSKILTYLKNTWRQILENNVRKCTVATPVCIPRLPHMSVFHGLQCNELAQSVWPHFPADFSVLQNGEDRLGTHSAYCPMRTGFFCGRLVQVS